MKTTFQEDVIELVLQIPKGRVTSYGTIAKFLGHTRGARMVGWVMNNCQVINQTKKYKNSCTPSSKSKWLIKWKTPF